MKTSKRERNFIVFTFGFYVIVFIILLIYTFTYFIPNIKEIETKKQELRILYNTKSELEKKWLLYSDFKSLNQSTKDKYLISILSSIDKDFYDKNFINTWDSNYESFISNKIVDINSWENNDKLKLLNSKISKILPSYLKDYSWANKDTLTNFKYINYLESIFQTFWLKTTDSLWITNIELLTDYNQMDWKNNNWLDVNLFSIPLKLTLKWKKDWIVNFLHFAKYVWKIELNNDSSDFYVYKDKFLKTKYWDIILKWIPYDNLSSYNIYENQLFEIDYIKLKNNIDSSNNFKWNLELADYIKNSQANEDYEIEVLLKFYIKWIQQYELSTFITNLLDKYTQLTNEVNKKVKDPKTNKYDIVTYKNIAKYLNDLNSDMQNLKKELAKNQNLEQLYSKIVKHKNSLLKIEELIPIK